MTQIIELSTFLRLLDFLLRVNGSYEAMVGGCAAEAMEDFTGGLCETFKLKNPKKLPPDLFTVMRKASERSSLLGCTIDVRRIFRNLS